MLDIPPKGKKLQIDIKQCSYHNLPYLVTSHPSSFWHKQLPPSLRHNVWILTVGNNDPISVNQVIQDIEKNPITGKDNNLQFVISKRESTPPKTSIERHWTAFEQMAPFIKIDKQVEDDIGSNNDGPVIVNQNDKLIEQPQRRSERLRKTIHQPKINKLIEAPTKPDTPQHPGEAMRSPYQCDWMEALFACFDKMYNT